LTTALEGVRIHAPVTLYPRKDPVTIVQETVWAPGPVSTRAGNLAPTGIRSPDFPASSQSLYRLSYPDENERLPEYDAVHTGKYLLILHRRFTPPSLGWQVPPETWYLFPVGNALYLPALTGVLISP